jgi:hypothetical protein
MSRRTSPDEPYPVTGYRSQPSGTAPVEDPQTTQLGTSTSGRTITPRTSSFFQEGRPTSPNVAHRESNTGVPCYGAPEVGSDLAVGSPTRTRGRRDSLILAPPSRPVSHGGSALVERDPQVAQLPLSRSQSTLGSQSNLYDRPRSEPRGGDGLSPPTLSTESSVTTTIQFDRLAGVIPEDQLTELRHLVSNHSLQRCKLVTAGSYLCNLFEETQTM